LENRRGKITTSSFKAGKDVCSSEFACDL